MAADAELTKRFYKAIARRKGVSEKRMMGGLCFLLNGNMIGGADRHKDTQYGRFMFRVGKDNEAAALAFPCVTVVEQGGRKMSGLVFVDADNCSEANLKALAQLALNFVKDLPDK